MRSSSADRGHRWNDGRFGGERGDKDSRHGASGAKKNNFMGDGPGDKKIAGKRDRADVEHREVTEDFGGNQQGARGPRGGRWNGPANNAGSRVDNQGSYKGYTSYNKNFHQKSGANPQKRDFSPRSHDGNPQSSAHPTTMPTNSNVNPRPSNPRHEPYQGPQAPNTRPYPSNPKNNNNKNKTNTKPPTRDLKTHKNYNNYNRKSSENFTVNNDNNYRKRSDYGNNEGKRGGHGGHGEKGLEYVAKEEEGYYEQNKGKFFWGNSYR
jgi:hypothetical protein